jgi:hypothetical protein
MRLVALCLAVVSLFAGFASALFWLRSSRVNINPGWVVEPGEVGAAQAGWIAALLKASSEAASLNKRGALWAAVSVETGSLSGFIGLVS